MNRVIDTPWNVTPHLDKMRAAGVETIIRYYNHRNSQKLPDKRIERPEAIAIANEGLRMCTVFQQTGGNPNVGGSISDLDAVSGKRDAERAFELADRIEQPPGSAIYFAVDHDYHKADDIASILEYFEAIREQSGSKFRIGVYGSGKVGAAAHDAGYADLIWLAAASRWSGTRQLLSTDKWALYQKAPPIATPLPHDANKVSPSWPDYGQFIPGTALEEAFTPDSPAPVNTVMMEVVARRGLNVRRGPGEQYAIEQTLEQGTVIEALARHGNWIQVDLEGDGLADGHAHADYLVPVSGGFPIAPALFDAGDAIASAAILPTPYDVARAELALDVQEVKGPGNNPRIVMYHNTTNAWSGTDDAVSWCSSFVNYCVEQAGLVGTDSQRALDWKDWGEDASSDPQEGDIAIFERVGKGGHVGFFVEATQSHVTVLSGNASNRVKISTYPKDGKLGSTNYKLRSIRRA